MDLVQSALGRLHHVVGLLDIAVGLLHTTDLVVHPLTDGQAG